MNASRVNSVSHAEKFKETVFTARRHEKILGRWPSGQWHQTVNLTDFVLRGFESLPTHSFFHKMIENCGCSSMAEPLPSKQVMGVRFSSPALFQLGMNQAAVAQR